MTPETLKIAFKERKVLPKIILLMVASAIGVCVIAFFDLQEGNEDYLHAALTMLCALEGGILMGYLTVRGALLDNPKTPKF